MSGARSADLLIKIQVLAAATIWCSFVAADETPPFWGGQDATVIIVSLARCCGEEAWPEAEHHLEQELSMLGWKTLVIDGAAVDESERRYELEELARKHGALCSIRILRSSGKRAGGVDLWISDALTKKMIIRHVPLGDASDADEAMMVSLETVALLRASLLELKLDAAQDDKPVDMPAPAEDLLDDVEVVLVTESAPRPPSWSLELGVGGLGSPGGIGALGVVELAAALSPVEHFIVEVDSLVSVLGRDIEAFDSGASFDLAALRATFLWEFQASRLLLPSIGVGGGVLFFWTRGFGAQAYRGVWDSGFTYLLGVAASLRLRLVDNLSIVFGARVDVALPEVEIFFGDNLAARFGRPIVEGLLRLELFL